MFSPNNYNCVKMSKRFTSYISTEIEKVLKIPRLIRNIKKIHVLLSPIQYIDLLEPLLFLMLYSSVNKIFYVKCKHFSDLHK